MTEDEGITVSEAKAYYCSGMLGATAEHWELLEEARLVMIERRILRLEMLLRRAGIEPESVELPK